MFNSNANFTEIVSNGSLQVTSLLQNVKIEVDEEGTLAAADTGILYETLVPLQSLRFTYSAVLIKPYLTRSWTRIPVFIWQ